MYSRPAVHPREITRCNVAVYSNEKKLNGIRFATTSTLLEVETAVLKLRLQVFLQHSIKRFSLK